MVKQIREKLIEDYSIIENLLESLGCHSFKYQSGELRCSLPDGDNSTSVQIYLNESLNVNVWTRNEFEDMEYKDLFSFIQYLTGKNFHQTINYLCEKLGIENNSNSNNFKVSDSLKHIKKYKQKTQKQLNHTVMSEEYLKNFRKYTVKDWLDEGIDENTQREFEVFIDEKHSRWKFPIRDENGNLITTKGRTYVDDFEILGIYKYLYFPPFGTNDILFNVHKALPYIIEKNEVIIFESEKSVMKAWSMGIRNCVAIGNKIINPHLVKKILQLNCSKIVLALDKDVKEKEIILEVKKLKLFKNVYYILDTDDLLDKKDSPIDKGEYVWYALYDEKRRG